MIWALIHLYWYWLFNIRYKELIKRKYMSVQNFLELRKFNFERKICKTGTFSYFCRNVTKFKKIICFFLNNFSAKLCTKFFKGKFRQRTKNNFYKVCRCIVQSIESFFSFKLHTGDTESLDRCE